MSDNTVPGARAAGGASLDLCGVWRFQPDACQEGEKLAYPQPRTDVRRWREVMVPCAFDECAPALAAYEGAGWFRREFDLPAEWVAAAPVLRFEGVNYHATVWVNGRLAGDHEGGFLRFELPLTGLVAAGPNTLVVRADSTRRHGQVPGKQRGWRPFGGILREVVVDCRRLVRLEHPVVLARGDGAFEAGVILRNDSAQAREVTVAFAITDTAGRPVGAAEAQATTIPAHGETAAEFTGLARDFTAWTPDTPFLYTAMFVLSDGVGTDESRTPFGFRTIEAHGTQLLLNGQSIRLRGFNRHEDSFRTGMTPDPELAENDLRQMKEVGANFVRLCHYPHHPSTLDLCDRLGLLVLAEIPVYWWAGAEGDQPPAAKVAAARHQLRSLITRDLNHPSIILWSVSNETDEARPEVVAGNAELVSLVKDLDPTRLAVHVSDHWPTTPHFEQDDVLCVNGYPSYGGRGVHADPQYDFGAATRWWDEHLAQLHTAHPDRPILITEFGYPCLPGVFGTGVGEDMQLAALQAEARAFHQPYVCGMTIWCYADHPWPEEPFLNYVTTSPYGVLTRERRPKQAWAVIPELFGMRQAPAAAPAAPAAAGPVPVRMIRPHLRDLPEVPFPEGFGIRPMTVHDAGLWEDVERDAEPFLTIGYGLFMAEFGDDPGAIERRCFLVTDPNGCAVGTVSAWYSRDFRDEDWGRIHWLAIRRAFQGRGLGRAALAYALKQLATWHERAFLYTDTGRPEAIKLYLDFGFLPDVTGPASRECWLAIRTQVNHPALAILDQ